MSQKSDRNRTKTTPKGDDVFLQQNANESSLVNPVIPKFDSFQDGFLHGWNRGLGLSGPTRPWTLAELEYAFEDRQHCVSDKSIENWRSGRTTPNRKNRLILADIFAGGDALTRDTWMQRFEASMSTRDAEKQQESKPEPNLHLSHKHERITQRRLSLSLILGCAACVFIAAILMVSVRHYRSTPDTDVSNGSSIFDLRFCGEDSFDKSTKRCLDDQRVFEEGTSLIHVTFESVGIGYGQAFQRYWYREGRKFLEREGYFDDAWENWTWIANPDGHDPGKYHLRIVINETVTTASFQVEGDVAPVDLVEEYGKSR